MAPSELEALEHDVLEHLAGDEGHVGEDLEEAAVFASVADEEPARSPVRLAVAMAFPAGAAPPVELTAGWQAILGWLLGIVGFAAAWVAVVVKKPSFGLLLPLPVAAIAGISVPDSDQVASGLAVLVLFAVGLGMLSGSQMGSADEKLPAGYEVRRALRALPLLALVTGGLYLVAPT